MLGTREEQKQQMKMMAILAEATNKRPCKKCSSRGFEGWDEMKGQYIPCICVIKASVKIKMEKFKNGQTTTTPEKP